MIFTGLAASQLWALFLVAGSVITVLYILKLRRRAVEIPFAPLWQKILRDKEATALYSKLKRLLSLLLQLALLALLVLALGDPRPKESLLSGRNLVVLLDTSASMQATDVRPSDSKTLLQNRLGVAKEKVAHMISGMSGADQMLLATMDAVVTPLSPMTSEPSVLARALEDVRPTDARADFARALRFSADALSGRERAEIIVVSDGNLGEPFGEAAVPQGVEISYVPIGKSGRNVAITQFSVRRYPLDKSRYEVMLELVNTGPNEEDVELGLFGDGVLVDVTKLKLRAGERLPRFYPNLSGASRVLHTTIEPLSGSEDVLPTDNRAFALLPERRRAKVLVVTEGNTYLEAALLLDEYLDVTETTPKGYPQKISQGKYDVVVFDAATPVDPPNAHALYLDPRGPGSPVKVLGEVHDPAFTKVETKHPIVKHLALDFVGISAAHKLVPEAGDKVVGLSAADPILVSGERKGKKFVALGFDVRDSDFPLRTAFPLFVMGVVNFFVEEDADYLSSFRTGEVWRIPVPGHPTSARLTGPDGSVHTIPVFDGRAVYLGTHAGIYSLSVGSDPDLLLAGPGGGPLALEFAANLVSLDESSVAPQDKLVVSGREASTPTPFHAGVRREMWIYLLLIAVLVTAIEWMTYHRRWTV